MHPKKMLYLLLLLCLSPLCHGRLNGAPEDACGSMTPQHGGTLAQVSQSPYELDAEPLSGNRFQVTLELRVRDEAPFEGFFIQAQNSAGKNIGSFEYDPSSIRTVACSSEFPRSAITHTSNTRKVSLSVTWTPPNNYSGVVSFRATVVQSFTRFWTGLKVDRQVIGQYGGGSGGGSQYGQGGSQYYNSANSMTAPLAVIGTVLAIVARHI